MAKLALATFTAIWAALAQAGAVPTAREVSPETLAALDPTRLAALTCRGGGGTVLARRLRLARDFAARHQAGQGPLPLYPGIVRSDLELLGIVVPQTVVLDGDLEVRPGQVEACHEPPVVLDHELGHGRR